jgi:hypothetical protein
MDPDTKEVKKRVVLDMSRHIKNLLVPQYVQLDDLKATEAMRSPEDHMCIFNQENQYFHFNFMIFGFAAAAAVVARLIKSVMGSFIS